MGGGSRGGEREGGRVDRRSINGGERATAEVGKEGLRGVVGTGAGAKQRGKASRRGRERDGRSRGTKGVGVSGGAVGEAGRQGRGGEQFKRAVPGGGKGGARARGGVEDSGTGR